MEEQRSLHVLCMCLSVISCYKGTKNLHSRQVFLLFSGEISKFSPPFCFFTARFCYFPVCFHMQYTARRQLLPFAKRVPHTFLPRFTVFSASVFRALFPRASRSRCRPCVSAPELTILRGRNDDIWGGKWSLPGREMTTLAAEALRGRQAAQAAGIKAASRRRGGGLSGSGKCSGKFCFCVINM